MSAASASPVPKSSPPRWHRAKMPLPPLVEAQYDPLLVAPGGGGLERLMRQVYVLAPTKLSPAALRAHQELAGTPFRLQVVSKAAVRRFPELRYSVSRKAGGAHRMARVRLAHEPSFLNHPSHDRARTGFAINFANLTVLVGGTAPLPAGTSADEIITIDLNGGAGTAAAAGTDPGRLVWDATRSSMECNLIIANSPPRTAAMAAAGSAARKHVSRLADVDRQTTDGGPGLLRSLTHHPLVESMAGLAVEILERRHAELYPARGVGAGATRDVIFSLPLASLQSHPHAAQLLLLLLAMLEPTYFSSGEETDSARLGDQPSTGINAAIIKVQGLFVGLGLGNHSCLPLAAAVEAMQCHLRAMTWRNHSSWKLLKNQELDAWCHCSPSEEIKARYGCFFPAAAAATAANLFGRKSKESSSIPFVRDGHSIETAIEIDSGDEEEAKSSSSNWWEPPQRVKLEVGVEEEEEEEERMLDSPLHFLGNGNDDDGAYQHVDVFPLSPLPESHPEVQPAQVMELDDEVPAPAALAPAPKQAEPLSDLMAAFKEAREVEGRLRHQLQEHKALLARRFEATVQQAREQFGVNLSITMMEQ
jgi:hypothetical protein